MSNIKGIGDKTGNWKNNVRLVKALEPITVLPKKVGTIKQVVSDFYGNITFLSHKGHVYQSSSKSYTSTLKAVQNLPPIKSIHSGYHHLFAMTKGSDPKIYGWGFNNYFQLGLPMERTYDKPTLIPYSKKIQIHEIHPSGYASLFLDTKEHILYGCGNNTHGQTAIKNSSSKVKTIKRAYKNVSKVFTGHAAHSYLIKSDGRLYAFGCNFGLFFIFESFFLLLFFLFGWIPKFFLFSC
ncbi:hypothetical protein M0813_12351 [Anaeramoeba flamelloides]|uniref:Uncharacterized protein n=1 Tax=Anaeramoeba flamelloides TaxID=1746091 RepID=A0ABQ8ZCA7_9EUKA|nr:hypothetical protein M0813_12351 [Anaeramoeba flamelloides]